MKDKRLEQQLQHSLNAALSGLHTTSCQRNQYYENATGGHKVKRKLTYGLMIALIMALTLATTSVAFALTHGFGILDFAASHRDNVEVPQAAADDFLHDLATVDCGHAAVVFREASYDGMTCHLVYDVIPKEKDMLLFDGITDESWYALTHLNWDRSVPLADDRTILDRWQEGGYTSAWEVDFDVSSVDGADYMDVYGGMGSLLNEDTGVYTGTIEIPFQEFKAERNIRLSVRLLPLLDIFEEFSYDYDHAEYADLEYTFRTEEAADTILRADGAPILFSSVGITVNEITMTVLPQEIIYQIAYAITDPAAFHSAFGFPYGENAQFRFVSIDPESQAVSILPEGITFEFSQHTVDEEKAQYVQRGTLGRSTLQDTYTLGIFRNLYEKPLHPLETVTVTMQ